MIRRLSTFALLFLLSSDCYAQDNMPWAGFGIEANYFSGKVLKHEAKFTLPIPDISNGADINFFQKTYGKHDWEQRRRYPVLGVGVAYTNYGINAIYGKCFSIYPNFAIPIITGRKLEWTMRIGNGIGYVTRDFSRVAPVDTINVAIGSHINDYFSFLTDVRYNLNDHLDIQAGINFSHISDAAFHQPNLGVNMYGVHIGIRYSPVTAHPKRMHQELKQLKNRWLVEFTSAFAYNTSNAPKGPLYPVYTEAGLISRRWMSKNKAFAGFDYTYHTNFYAYLRNNINFVQPGTESVRASHISAFIGNEFLLGRVGIILQVGRYFNPDFLFGSVYEKFGAKIYLISKESGPVKNLSLFYLVKVHATVAELVEFGVGIGF